MSILKRRKNITLQQRLAQLTGHLAEINGEGLGLDPGKLQRVFKKISFRFRANCSSR
ncbi:hypothetical protein VQ056_15820 [Paenibacillus sp. JTLBN-2024]